MNLKADDPSTKSGLDASTKVSKVHQAAEDARRRIARRTAAYDHLVAKDANRARETEELKAELLRQHAEIMRLSAGDRDRGQQQANKEVIDNTASFFDTLVRAYDIIIRHSPSRASAYQRDLDIALTTWVGLRNEPVVDVTELDGEDMHDAVGRWTEGRRDHINKIHGQVMKAEDLLSRRMPRIIDTLEETDKDAALELMGEAGDWAKRVGNSAQWVLHYVKNVQDYIAKNKKKQAEIMRTQAKLMTMNEGLALRAMRKADGEADDDLLCMCFVEEGQAVQEGQGADVEIETVWTELDVPIGHRIDAQPEVLDLHHGKITGTS